MHRSILQKKLAKRIPMYVNETEKQKPLNCNRFNKGCINKHHLAHYFMQATEIPVHLYLIHLHIRQDH